jgi:predicted metalloprotease with PDZ domain
MGSALLAATAAAAIWVPAFAGTIGVEGQAEPLARITVKPGPMSETRGGVIEITEGFGAMEIAAGAPFLALANYAPGMTRPDRMEGLAVADAQGPVPLKPNKADAPTAWTAGRAVRGEVTIRYRLIAENDTKATGGPQGSTRVDGDGVSSIGSHLLMLPRTKAAYRVAFKWDLSAMATAVSATSSFGDGDFTLPAGPLGRLSEAFYMAGTIKRVPADRKGAFAAVRTGDPGMDLTPSLLWAQQLYGWMSRFFGDPHEPYYRIFMRYNPASNAGGGTAVPHSFLWTWGDGVQAEQLKPLLGHEMTHTWTASGIGKWYSEGDAVYYQARLPWLAGQLTTEQYLRDINLTAARYYTNEWSHYSDQQVMAKYWEDARTIVIPYDRGALYHAVLEGKIRKVSGGKRSVDELVREVADRNRKGLTTTEADWTAMVRKALGDEGVAITKAMMAGEIMVPDSDAYGPCFRRVAAKIRRYEPGYDQMIAKNQNLVKNLVAGSEAAKAGVREGDAIVLRTNTDGHQRDPAMMLTVQITRDGKTFPITYLPRGAAVDAYQWERVAGVSDEACKAAVGGRG